jgi:superfamily I DNA and RNA helicase
MMAFDTRDAELASIAESIVRDVNEEGVTPEQILVISLDSISAKKYMGDLQNRLYDQGIASVVPGLIDEADQFAETGRVTLSTVYRAKGNEAPLVYILGFDSMYNYVREVETRNRAFTCITRSKGWVRISGVGAKMNEAQREIELIRADLPNFRFTFPDMNTIHRNLDAAETTRRRQEVKAAQKSVRALAEADLGALSELPPDQLVALLEKLQKLQEIRGEPK